MRQRAGRSAAAMGVQGAELRRRQLVRPTAAEQLYAASCGDGIIQAGVKPATTPTESPPTPAPQATIARCDVVLLRLAEGAEGYEACDDGNEVNTDACLNRAPWLAL